MTRIAADWLDEAPARAVTGALGASGHVVLYVGGCVRNALLGRAVADIDLATDAEPEAVMALAEAAGLRAIPTGIEHGTVTVLADGRPFEVTTFRRDVETFGRRAVVAFTSDIAEDAARRDFTMNALYARPDGAVVDPLGGLADLRAGRVRFVGEPSERIAEDYLRILRFFRIHAWYGDAEGGLDAEGLAACAAAVEGLGLISRERVGAEMAKLLAAPDPAPAVAAMAASGILGAVLPGADARALAPLVHAEAAAGVAPRWQRRLGAMGWQEDWADALRLSRSDARTLATISAILRGGRAACRGCVPAWRRAGARRGADPCGEPGRSAAGGSGGGAGARRGRGLSGGGRRGGTVRAGARPGAGADARGVDRLGVRPGPGGSARARRRVASCGNPALALALIESLARSKRNISGTKESMMSAETLKETAEKLVSNCREHRTIPGLSELYDPDAVSVEATKMPGSDSRETHGVEGIKGKHEWWTSTMEVHDEQIEGPFLHGEDRFAVIFGFDATDKSSGRRMQMREVGIYTVNDAGKIVREEFFYTT